MLFAVFLDFKEPVKALLKSSCTFRKMLAKYRFCAPSLLWGCQVMCLKEDGSLACMILRFNFSATLTQTPRLSRDHFSRSQNLLCYECQQVDVYLNSSFFIQINYSLNLIKVYFCSSWNTMPWILSKIIPSKVVVNEVLFLRKSEAELVLTNLKTFDAFVFHNYQK